MSQQIRLWIDGAETEPMDEQQVRDQVVGGLIPNLTLARLDRSAPTDWKPVGVILAEADKTKAGAGPSVRSNLWDTVGRTRIAVYSITLGVAVQIVAALVWISSSPSARVYYPSDDAAYVAATNYAMRELVGLTRIIERGLITDAGNEWSVALRVDGLNAFGGPVRKNITVLMTHSPSYGYHLNAVKQ